MPHRSSYIPSTIYIEKLGVYLVKTIVFPGKGKTFRTSFKYSGFNEMG